MSYCSNVIIVKLIKMFSRHWIRGQRSPAPGLFTVIIPELVYLNHCVSAEWRSSDFSNFLLHFILPLSDMCNMSWTPTPPSPKKVQFVWGKKFFLLLYSVVRCYHPNYNTACKQKQVWRGQIGFHINSFYGLWMKLKIYSTHLVFIGFFFFF